MLIILNRKNKGIRCALPFCAKICVYACKCLWVQVYIYHGRIWSSEDNLRCQRVFHIKTGSLVQKYTPILLACESPVSAGTLCARFCLWLYMGSSNQMQVLTQSPPLSMTSNC